MNLNYEDTVKISFIKLPSTSQLMPQEKGYTIDTTQIMTKNRDDKDYQMDAITQWNVMPCIRRGSNFAFFAAL